MASLAPLFFPQFFDDNGDPLAGGKLYTYLAGTSTPATTYVDEAATPNTNPIILDSAGRCKVWLSNSTSYKFVLKNSSDVPVTQEDGISSASSSGSGTDPGAWTEHTVTDGQAATNLTGETVDLALYSSAFYDYEISRGTTVIASGNFAIQNLNGTGRLLTGSFIADEAHGVTFSISQVALVVQLKAATDVGAGAGTIKLSRRLVPV